MKGNKIELRPFERHHIAKLVEWRNDPEVALWSDGRNPAYELVTLEEAETSFSNSLKNGSKFDRFSYTYMFAIHTLEGQYIGMADYRDVDKIKRSCTIGITIGEKDYWEKGYGSDAINVLVEFLFHRLNLRRIQLDTWSDNKRAIKAYLKCGFSIEGTLKESEYIVGKYYDTIIMGLLRRDWPGTQHTD